MRGTITRKGFLKATGAGAAGAALVGTTLVAARQRLGSAPAEKPDTNVVLVILDSFRKDHVGAYGNDWIQTPTLDALAQESLRFTQAYPESMPTLPARRAIHTGLRTFPFDHYTPEEQRRSLMYGWRPIPDGQPSLAEIMDNSGFETIFVTDNYHQFKPEMNFHKGFETFQYIRGQETDRYKPYWTVSKEKMNQYLDVEETRTRHHLANTAGRETEEDYFAPQVFIQASELLEAAPARQPFFMVVDCFDPHEPWDPPEEYVNLYDTGDYDGPEPFCPAYRKADYLTKRQIQRMQALYAGEATMVDRWLGRFVKKIDDLGLRENTLLVVLSDHGHLLGEHNTTGKPHYGLWPELTDILFMIRHPEGKKAGQTSDYYASTHDVAPTILGALGLKPKEPMEGQDLSVLLDDEEPEPRPYFTIGYHTYSWARDEQYVMFTRNDREWTRLYDVQKDPRQTKDLSGRRPEIVNKMYYDYISRDAGGPPRIY